MSDQDARGIVRDYFNSRCRDRKGKPYPWHKEEVSWAVDIALANQLLHPGPATGTGGHHQRLGA